MTWAFDRETAVEATGDGTFRADVSGAWNIGENPNGGYSASLLTAAMGESIDHPDPLSITTHYLRPAVSGQPATMTVEVLKTGRRTTTATARLIQDDKVRVVALASYGNLAAAEGETNIEIERPSMPPPAECASRVSLEQGIALPITDRIEARVLPEQAVWSTGGKPRIDGWIRFLDERPPDPRALLQFADAFPPSVFSLYGKIGWVPTLELTVQIRNRPEPGWIQALLRSADVQDGIVIEDGVLWDSTGAIVAQFRQTALVLKEEA